MKGVPIGVGAFCIVAVALTTADGAEREGHVQRGKALYDSRCTACHSLDHSRIGPAHRGVFGRHVAQVAGFDYSPALRRSYVSPTQKCSFRGKKWVIRCRTHRTGLTSLRSWRVQTRGDLTEIYLISDSVRNRPNEVHRQS
jgi:Cytochrome c